MRFFGAGGKMGFGRPTFETFHVGGQFTNVNYGNEVGFIEMTRIGKWNGTAWSALGSGMNNSVQSLAVDSSDNLYAGGGFTTANGVTVNRIAKWNGTQFSALGSGINNSVFALAFDSSGNLYVGGFFTTAGGTASNRIARWNTTSSAWEYPFGSGMNNGIYTLAFDSNENLYAGGYFTTAGGIDALRTAKWNGSSWEKWIDADNVVRTLLITDPK